MRFLHFGYLEFLIFFYFIGMMWNLVSFGTCYVKKKKTNKQKKNLMDMTWKIVTLVPKND